VDGLGLTRVKQEALPNDSRASGATSPVWSEEALNEWLKIENERQRVLSRGAGASNEPSSIWSEGVENEYEADIYPSKLAATRALGRRMRGPIEAVIEDMNTATEIVIFQDESDARLAKPFKQALAETLSDVPCSVLYGSRNIDDDEIGITLRSDYVQGWGPSGGESQIIKTQVLADARHRDWEVTIAQEYIEKPWVGISRPTLARGPKGSLSSPGRGRPARAKTRPETWPFATPAIRSLPWWPRNGPAGPRRPSVRPTSSMAVSSWISSSRASTACPAGSGEKPC
jgi:hypothetical protein